MSIFDIFKRKKQSRGLQYINGRHVGVSRSGAMALSTVYRCVDSISDGVAQLPISVYRITADGHKEKTTSRLSYVLNTEPHRNYSRYSFFKIMVVSMLLRGNAYALIHRDEQGEVVSLEYIPTEKVTVFKTNADEVIYSVVGVGYVEACNMLHVLNFTYDGITGVSTLTHARNAIDISADSEAHAGGFFKGGGNISGYIKVAKTLTPQQKQSVKESWIELINDGGNSVAVLEGDMDYNTISLNPSDLQLLESRNYNVVEICRFFNVSPVKCFDLTKSSYNTVEATQLAFLTDTLSPLLSKIENELLRKVVLPSQRETTVISFDTSVLLRADKTALSNYYRTLFNIGVLTPNEIRGQLDLPPIEGGNEVYLQSNITTVKKIQDDRSSN